MAGRIGTKPTVGHRRREGRQRRVRRLLGGRTALRQAGRESRRPANPWSGLLPAAARCFDDDRPGLTGWSPRRGASRVSVVLAAGPDGALHDDLSVTPGRSLAVDAGVGPPPQHDRRPLPCTGKVGAGSCQWIKSGRWCPRCRSVRGGKRRWTPPAPCRRFGWRADTRGESGPGPFCAHGCRSAGRRRSGKATFQFASPLFS